MDKDALLHQLGSKLRKIKADLPGMREEVELLVLEYEKYCQEEYSRQLRVAYDAAAALE